MGSESSSDRRQARGTPPRTATKSISSWPIRVHPARPEPGRPFPDRLHAHPDPEDSRLLAGTPAGSAWHSSSRRPYPAYREESGKRFRLPIAMIAGHQITKHRRIREAECLRALLTPGKLDNRRGHARIGQRFDHLRKIRPVVLLPGGDKFFVEEIPIPDKQAGNRGDGLPAILRACFLQQSSDPLARNGWGHRRRPDFLKLCVGRDAGGKKCKQKNRRTEKIHDVNSAAREKRLSL